MLALGNERAILWELTQRDPLDLEERCTDHMRRRAMLLPAERVFLQAAVRIAYHARAYDGALAIDVWLEERIDQAIEDLLREEMTETAISSDLEISLELRMVLQEIAGNPNARFFKGEIPRPERITLGSIEPVSNWASWLTSAERKLVQVHREEMAYLLRLAAASVLAEDPWMHQVSFLYQGPSTRLVVPTRSEMVRLLEDASSLERGQGDPVGARKDLVNARNLLSAGSVDAARFAALSLRLLPNSWTYIHLARHLLVRRQNEAAECMLWSIARQAKQTLIGAVALSWIGVMRARAAQYSKAAMIHRAAAEWGQTLASDHFSWMGCAILVGDRVSAVEAMRQIDERYEVSMALVDEWTTSRKLEREHSVWNPSLESRSLAQEIMSCADSTARKVSDVYA